MSWSDERVEQLKALWAEGLSASQIARVIGGITRCSVIGKVHRLGLAGRAMTPTATRERTTPRSQKRLPPAPAVVIPTDADIPPAERVKIMDLTYDSCRWPIGDPLEPDFGFCNRTRMDGSSYCERHYVQSRQAGSVIAARATRARRKADEAERDVVEEMSAA